MTHMYNISGMTCDGCRNKVEKTLNTIDGITASVSLSPPVATITMDKHIPISQLQEALTVAGKYTIQVSNDLDKQDEILDEKVESLVAPQN